jgi:hypothetical protein
MREAFHYFVAEVMIFVAFSSEALAVQCDSTSEFNGSCVEEPLIGRNEPRPADYTAFAESLDSNGAASGSKDFESDLALSDEVEFISHFAFAMDVFAGVKADVRGAADEEFKILFIEIFKKGMASQIRFDGLHDNFSYR